MNDRPAVDSYALWAARREQGAKKAAEHGRPALAEQIRNTTTKANHEAAKTGGWWRK